MKIDFTGDGPPGLDPAHPGRRRIAGCDVHISRHSAPGATFGLAWILQRRLIRTSGPAGDAERSGAAGTL